MHGGEQVDGALLNTSGDVRLVVKPRLPPRLNCGCNGGNGRTPFLFMQWLADSKHEFAWYVEEDVVFTGHWQELFDLRGDHDLIAHITKPTRRWQKRCQMPGKKSCFTNGILFKTKWPVIGGVLLHERWSTRAWPLERVDCFADIHVL